MSTDIQEKPPTPTLLTPFKPFTLEVGDCDAKPDKGMVYRKNRPILLEAFRMKLRGRFSFGNQRGRTFGDLAGMPDVPGIFVEVKPDRRRIRIFDPLDPDEKAPGSDNYKGILDDMNAIIKTAAHGRIFAVEKPSKPILNEHQFKTFIRELIQWNESGNIYKLHVGQLPSREQVDKLPGKYMCNQYNNGQVPKFEKEYDDYLDNLIRVGIA